jgi:hypothetical protein
MTVKQLLERPEREDQGSPLIRLLCAGLGFLLDLLPILAWKVTDSLGFERSLPQKISARRRRQPVLVTVEVRPVIVRRTR